MKFKITPEEAERAKQEGMTAPILRAELFTAAIEALNHYTANMEALFNNLDYSRRIFTRNSVLDAIGHRSVSILKETGIIAVCGSGYIIQPDIIPHDELETMCQELEKFYFE